MSWGNPGAYRQMPEMAAMILQVVNLSVASAGSSGGGHLCLADSHSDPAALLIALGTSMLDHLRDGLSARCGVAPDPVAPIFAVTVPPAAATASSWYEDMCATSLRSSRLSGATRH